MKKLLQTCRPTRGISPYTAVYYGIFEYMIITDFFTRSGFQLLHHDPVLDRAYTGIEIYPGFEDFYAEKLRYESFLSRYAATRAEAFVYAGLDAKYASVFKELMRNLHATMLARAGLLDDLLFLKTNAPAYYPSDRITVKLTAGRMDRDGFIDYFTSDPVGTTVTIPEFLNPFPFEVHVATLINSFGFTVINPEPHIFSCDHSIETGVAIPDRLFGSQDLKDIDFIR
ncbi:MAG: hypothetical protein LC660_11785 [Desulfobacteraceae bacterium]|nr:hypothetical protein [Desulfobacteraceae bacterium]